MAEKYPWMEIAEHELGVHEIPGPEAEDRIVEYHSHTSLEATSDEVPWCAAFCCFCLEKAGFDSPHSARARDFLGWGREPEKGEYRGCICILERGSGGHVGFLQDWSDEDTVTLLGGNQGDKVCYATYDMGRVLGYRIP